MLRNNKGFSLIELMVVVAIIAILSMIAVPSYQNFTAKARQKEGFSLMGGYFTSAQASRAELGFFPGDFVQSGFQPTGTLNYRLTVADNATNAPFGTTSTTCFSTAGTCTCLPGACNPLYNSTWNENTVSAAGGAVGPAAPVGCNGAVTDTTFLAVASGVVKNGGQVDTYSMNQMKAVVMCNDGLL